MNEGPQETALAFSRPVDEGRRPRRQVLSLRDGYRTVVYIYGPLGPTKRVPVLYLHGIQSHPGWFVGSCVHLAGVGHRVFAVCRRGSGDNALHRGDADSAAQLLDDVETAGQYVLEVTGKDRLAVVGVSWGGKLAACYAASPQRKVKVASLTLVAPGIAPRVDMGLAGKLAVGLALLVAPQRRFEIPLSDLDLFTDNHAMRGYLQVDHHRLLRGTARFLNASRQLDVMLATAGVGAVSVPTTLILANDDRIIDNTRTRKVVDRLTGSAAMVKMLTGAHTLEFEEDPMPLYQTLAEGVGRDDQPGKS